MIKSIKTRTIHECYYEPEKDEVRSTQFNTYYKPDSIFISLEDDMITIKDSPYEEEGKTYHIDQIKNVIHFLDEVSK